MINTAIDNEIHDHEDPENMTKQELKNIVDEAIEQYAKNDKKKYKDIFYKLRGWNH